MQLKQTHIMYGFLTGLIMVVISAGLYAAKMHLTMPWLGLLVLVVHLIGLIMNAAAFSKENGSNVTFAQAFGSCMKATLIIALIVTVWTFASYYIFPNLQTEIMDQARQKLQGKGMSDALIEKSMKIVSMFDGPVVKSVFQLFGSVLLGALFSLIAAAVAKKNPQPAQMM